jgi:Flp pilus assembly secretin CpaC
MGNVRAGGTSRALHSNLRTSYRSFGISVCISRRDIVTFGRRVEERVLRLATGTSEVLRINNARTIIIGKPEIADANALAEGVIAVTAKSAGSTNMIVLDEKHDI